MSKIIEIMPDSLPPEVLKAIDEGRLALFAKETLLSLSEAELELERLRLLVQGWRV
jgi:hypothetical protein